jgi:hypothetical protein
MIAYDRLKYIIPADQALANKALQVALQQMTGVTQTELPQLSETVSQLETTKDLPLINALTVAVPSSIANYYINTLGQGSSVNNNIVITDILGTMVGYVQTTSLTQTVTILNSMDLSDLLLIYQTMYNVVIGDYNVVIDPGPPVIYQVVIPNGLPGEGTYVNENDALTALIGIAQAECTNLASTYPLEVSTLNTLWDNMANHVLNESALQAEANLVFANLTANDRQSIYGLILSLPDYGTDTAEGGKAQFLELAANTASFTGQAVIAAMREGRNQLVLGISGITTSSSIPAEPDPPPPEAELIPSTYTETEATNLVIK